MRFRKSIGILVICIVALSLVATLAGILSQHGPGEFEHESIRGEIVTIHGIGFYRHMSSELAVQGIAHDYVTLFIGIPLLMLSFLLAGKDSLKAKFLFTGTLGYFLLTYLFYLCMGTFNELFLVWVTLTSASFYAFILSLFSFELTNLKPYFSQKLPVIPVGGFLVFNSIIIGLMWFETIIPPLIDGSIYPVELEHYTTLIVQGLDLSIFLPASFLSGMLLIKKKVFGYLLAPIYLVFLSILMTALTAKVIGMSFIGIDVGPGIVIIPLFNAIAILCTVLIFKNINESKYTGRDIASPKIQGQ